MPTDRSSAHRVSGMKLEKQNRNGQVEAKSKKNFVGLSSPPRKLFLGGDELRSVIAALGR